MMWYMTLMLVVSKLQAACAASVGRLLVGSAV